MRHYFPDNWVVVFVNGDDPHYRVLAGWSGGYAAGDSWRMNSGITRAEEDNDSYLFYGSSGSCYVCGKESYCLRMNTAHVWNALQKQYDDKVVLLDENEDWLNKNWIIT